MRNLIYYLDILGSWVEFFHNSFWIAYGIVVMGGTLLLITYSTYVIITDPDGSKFRAKHGIREEAAE